MLYIYPASTRSRDSTRQNYCLSEVGRLESPLRVRSLLFVIAIWLAAGICVCRGDSNPTGAAPALLVNTQAVSAAEFQWYLEQEWPAAVRSINKRRLEGDTGAWEHVPGGTLPTSILLSNVVLRCLREKVEQGVFQELGLLPDASYEAFLAELDKSNQERAEAAARGRVVYGPVRYSRLQFYEHRKAILRIRARAALAEKLWHPTAEELYGFYATNRPLFRALPTFTLDVVTIKKDQRDATNAAETAFPATAAELLSQLRAGRPLTNILTTTRAPASGVRVSGQQLKDVSADLLGELFSSDRNLAQVEALTPGEVAYFKDSDAQVTLVRCVGTTPAAFRPSE